MANQVYWCNSPTCQFPTVSQDSICISHLFTLTSIFINFAISKFKINAKFDDKLFNPSSSEEYKNETQQGDEQDSEDL